MLAETRVIKYSDLVCNIQALTCSSTLGCSAILITLITH